MKSNSLFDAYKKRKENSQSNILKQYASVGNKAKTIVTNDTGQAKTMEMQFDTSLVDPALVRQLELLNQQVKFQEQKIKDLSLKDPNIK